MNNKHYSIATLQAGTYHNKDHFTLASITNGMSYYIGVLGYGKGTSAS